MLRTDQIGWFLLFVLSVLPLVLWSWLIPVADRFADLSLWGTTIGQMTGLVGTALFALSLILSARMKFFEPYFGGMNRVYTAHHIAGGLSFVLLMIHPLSLAMVYVQLSYADALAFLLPGYDWAVNMGIASLLLLMALLIITYYLDFPYELWRFTHKYLGVAFLFGAIHALFTSSDMSEPGLLRMYMTTLILLGSCAYVYRTVLGKFFVPKYAYEIRAIVSESKDTYDLILTPQAEGKRMEFLPGQFVYVTFLASGIGREAHPFSISSPPAREGFRLSIKALGDFSQRLAQLPAGTPVLVEGPYGRFSYRFDPSQEYLWIGGGIGITPFVSMAMSLTPGECQVDAYYCTRDSTEAVYLSALEAIAKKNPSFRIIPWFSKNRGRLTADAMQVISGDIRAKSIFLCGPPMMMHTLKKQLTRLGVPASRIHTEQFDML